MPKVNEYVKVAEAATILGVSQTTLRKWADSGVLPTRTLPGSGYRLFRREDLATLLREFERPPARQIHSIPKRRTK